MAIKTKAFGQFLVLHDDVEQEYEILVRVSAIDAVLPHESYTTLVMGGCHQDVKELAEDIIPHLERDAVIGRG